MSWFAAAGLANIAKSALKEAQRTIDKALDIKDDDPTTTTTLPLEPDDFFASWNLHENKEMEVAPVCKPIKQDVSLWGSFTGSFFEPPNSSKDTISTLSNLPSKLTNEKEVDETNLIIGEVGNASNPNRLSVISNESGKNSSESVESISNQTSCTTSPESELPSSVHSSNPSSKIQSDSVIVTSPSSLEIHSRGTLDCTATSDTEDFISPIEECSEELIDDLEDNSISYVSISESTAATILEPMKNLDEPITKGPSRANLLLGYTQTPNVIDIPREEDEGFLSDRTLVAGDTPMESSEEMGNSAHAQLQTMLEDAMTDAQKSRDFSPIGGGETSGPTSCDEAETATSSDIEIISSPNGDSSSTQSRHSPSKVIGMRAHKTDDDLIAKIKGHNRELSETSSISDDSHSSEVERLIRRISEVTEILECREAKLLDTNRRNAELQTLNNSLKNQLDSVLNQHHSENLTQITEEYTQRLSALEKKFQQAIRDKDHFRKQLEQCEKEGEMRVNRNEFELVINEKDQVIAELRQEGDKLSKEQLQHSNIIKKLRSKEKQQETQIKKLKDSVEDLTSETERLKRSLLAKEEVERTQIEAVHQLTFKNQKFDQELTLVKSQLDDVTQKYETCKKSLDAAKKDLLEKNRASSELQAREQVLHSLEIEKKMTESQNEQMMNQLEGLREQLRSTDLGVIQKEQNLREENAQLLRSLEESKRCNEELAQNVLEVSKPLIRQMEALQATYNSKVESFDKIEQTMSFKISELQTRLELATKSESIAKEECIRLTVKVADLESHLQVLKDELEVAKFALEEERTNKTLLKNDLENKIDELQLKLKKESIGRENLNKEIARLETQLVEERNAMEKERRQSEEKKISPTTTRNTSPTFSFPPLSRSESMNSSTWPIDDPSDSTYLGARSTNLLELQMLQTNLKQREGELQQLQWEMNRREHEKILLNSHIAQLTRQTEDLEEKAIELEQLKQQHRELQCQYETLLQLYGEQVEQVEELKLDLQDVKDLYKTQVDEFVKQKHQQQQQQQEN